MNILSGFCVGTLDGAFDWYKFDSKPDGSDGTIGCKKIGTLKKSTGTGILAATNVPGDGWIEVSIVNQTEEY